MMDVHELSTEIQKRLAQCVEDLTTNGRQALPDAPRAAGKLFSHNVSSNWLLHVGAAWEGAYGLCMHTGDYSRASFGA